MTPWRLQFELVALAAITMAMASCTPPPRALPDRLQLFEGGWSSGSTQRPTKLETGNTVTEVP